METAGWIDVIRKEGRRMGVVIAGLPPDAPVPSCPGWRARKLVHHLGRVHRWAALMISEARAEPPARLDEIIPEGWPSDDDLAGWFREGHLRLAAALEEAPADLRCWTFMEAPSPRDFWARRQAHETSIHRVDAELAAGMDPTGFDAAYAADGIDELLVSFIRRPGRSPSAPGEMTMGVEAVDASRSWTVSFGPGEARGRRGAGEADCTVSGAASDLFTFLWNRTPPRGLRVAGDWEVLVRWAESSRF